MQGSALTLRTVKLGGAAPAVRAYGVVEAQFVATTAERLRWSLAGHLPPMPPVRRGTNKHGYSPWRPKAVPGCDCQIAPNSSQPPHDGAIEIAIGQHAYLVRKRSCPGSVKLPPSPANRSPTAPGIDCSHEICHRIDNNGVSRFEQARQISSANCRCAWNVVRGWTNEVVVQDAIRRNTKIRSLVSVVSASPARCSPCLKPSDLIGEDIAQPVIGKVAANRVVRPQKISFRDGVSGVLDHEAPYVLDGLLHHGTQLNIGTHYTDTGGASDHVFILCAMLGVPLLPTAARPARSQAGLHRAGRSLQDLQPLMGRRIKVDVVREHWDEVVRLVASL